MNIKVGSTLITSLLLITVLASYLFINRAPKQVLDVVVQETNFTPASNIILLSVSKPVSTAKTECTKVLIEDRPLRLPKTNMDSIANARLALKLINGYILKANGIFSFNAIVGPRTKDRGFLWAPLVKGYGWGGGVCKASTAAYQAAKEAGLEIIERHNHSIVVPYAKRGDDAMVSYGKKDNKFKNNQDFDIQIECSLGSDCIAHVRFYKLVYEKI